MGERRDKSKGARRQRHKARYGPKPASGAQVRASFKRARQGLGELSATLLRSEESSDAAVGDVNHMLEELRRIERALGVEEDKQEETLDDD